MKVIDYHYSHNRCDYACNDQCCGMHSNVDAHNEIRRMNTKIGKYANQWSCEGETGKRFPADKLFETTKHFLFLWNFKEVSIESVLLYIGITFVTLWYSAERNIVHEAFENNYIDIVNCNLIHSFNISSSFSFLVLLSSEPRGGSVLLKCSSDVDMKLMMQDCNFLLMLHEYVHQKLKSNTYRNWHKNYGWSHGSIHHLFQWDQDMRKTSM